MATSLIKVSQKHQHVIVKGAGGLSGKTGPKGDPGDVGPQGPAGTISVGQTSTLPAGSQATVSNIGTSENAIFSFGIPKGDKGDRGEAGAGLQITGTVATYADLPNDLGPSDAGKAYFVQADGKLYVWTGTAFPADGQGTQFEGPQGPQGEPGPEGFSPIANVSKSGTTTTITITDSQGTTTATVNDGTNINVNDSYSASTTEPYSANYVNTHTGTGTGPIGNSYQPVYLDGNNALQAGQSYADAAFVGPTLSTPSNVAYVATANIQDGAVTGSKVDLSTFDTDVSSSFSNTTGTLDHLGAYQQGNYVHLSMEISGLSISQGNYPTVVGSIDNAHTPAIEQAFACKARLSGVSNYTLALVYLTVGGQIRVISPLSNIDTVSLSIYYRI